MKHLITIFVSLLVGVVSMVGQNVDLTITTLKKGELASLLKDKESTIKSLAVRGPIGEKDFPALWSATFHGTVETIDLTGADIENDWIPTSAFFNAKEQLISDGPWTGITNLYSNLRHIYLPETIVEFGDIAFRNTSLEEIELPSSLEIIGESCFLYCEKLANEVLEIPEGVTAIERNTFYGCKSLKCHLKLPSTLRMIGEYAFQGVPLKSIDFPMALEKMEMYAFRLNELSELYLPVVIFDEYDFGQFSSSRYLEKVEIAEGVTEIPMEFFHGCTELKEVNLPESIESIGESAFYMNYSLNSIELPEGLESIGKDAFKLCKSLEYVVFPSTMKYLGRTSCEYWESIKGISCKATVPPVCDFNDMINSAFIELPFDEEVCKKCPLYVPRGCAELYKNAMGWCFFSTIIETDDFPTSGLDDVTFEGKNDNTIYNLNGQQISRPAKGQIYIRDGRKYIDF